MKKYYKFINEYRIEEFKNGFVIINNRIYTNPTEEKIKEAGYKELVETEIPEYNAETHYIDKKYVDGDVITAVYEIVEITEEII